MIGSFGSRIFRVSSDQVRTFDNLTQGVGIEVENTAVDGQKPSTAVKGQKLDDISFAVEIRDRWADVRSEIDAWQKLCRDGVPQVFTLGTRPVGQYKWLLTGVSLKDADIDNAGTFRRATLDLTLQEFVREGKASAAGGAGTTGGKVTRNPAGTVPATPAVAESAAPRTLEDKKRINGNVTASISKGPKTVARKPGTLYVLSKDA